MTKASRLTVAIAQNIVHNYLNNDNSFVILQLYSQQWI